MSFMGAAYKAKGGIAAYEQRFDTLAKAADEFGVLHPALTPPDTRNGFTKVADFLSRPNYAIAGAVEVAMGFGNADETVGGRFLREMLGMGERRAFGQVLETAGFDAGPRLSDVVGDNWITDRIGFNPSMRGTIALGMDIFLDPTTYVTFGTNGAQRVVSKGGEVMNLTKPGRKMVLAAQRVRFRRLAKGLDSWHLPKPKGKSPQISSLTRFSDELEEAIAKGDTAREFGLYRDMNDLVVRNLESSGNYKYYYDLNSNFMRNRLSKAAEADVAEYLMGNKVAPDLKAALDEVGVGADKAVAQRSMRFMGREVPGTADAFKWMESNATKQFEKLLETPVGSIAKAAEPAWATIYNFFNVHPWASRKVPVVRMLREDFDALNRRLGATATRNLDEIFGPKELSKTNTEMWEKLTRALNNPTGVVKGTETTHMAAWVEAATSAGKSAEWAKDIFAKVRTHNKRYAATDVRFNVLEADRVLDDYMPQMYENPERWNPDAERFYKQFMQRRGKVPRFAQENTLRGSGEIRKFDTIDEAEEFIAELVAKNGPNADPGLILDPRRLLERRWAVSHEAWAFSELKRRLYRYTVKDPKKALSDMLGEHMPFLKEVAQGEEITPEIAQKLMTLMEMSTTYWRRPTTVAKVLPDGQGVEAEFADFAQYDIDAMLHRNQITREVREGRTRARELEYGERPEVMEWRQLRDEADRLRGVSRETSAWGQRLSSQSQQAGESKRLASFIRAKRATEAAESRANLAYQQRWAKFRESLLKMPSMDAATETARKRWIETEALPLLDELASLERGAVTIQRNRLRTVLANSVDDSEFTWGTPAMAERWRLAESADERVALINERLGMLRQERDLANKAQRKIRRLVDAGGTPLHEMSEAQLRQAARDRKTLWVEAGRLRDGRLLGQLGLKDFTEWTSSFTRPQLDKLHTIGNELFPAGKLKWHPDKPLILGDRSSDDLLRGADELIGDLSFETKHVYDEIQRNFGTEGMTFTARDLRDMIGTKGAAGSQLRGKKGHLQASRMRKWLGELRRQGLIRRVEREDGKEVWQFVENPMRESIEGKADDWIESNVKILDGVKRWRIADAAGIPDETLIPVQLGHLTDEQLLRMRSALAGTANYTSNGVEGAYDAATRRRIDLLLDQKAAAISEENTQSLVKQLSNVSRMGRDELARIKNLPRDEQRAARIREIRERLANPSDEALRDVAPKMWNRIREDAAKAREEALFAEEELHTARAALAEAEAAHKFAIRERQSAEIRRRYMQAQAGKQRRAASTLTKRAKQFKKDNVDPKLTGGELRDWANKQLIEMPEGARALWAYNSLANVRDLKHLERLLAQHGEVFDSFEGSIAASLQKRIDDWTGEVIDPVSGQPWVDIVVGTDRVSVAKDIARKAGDPVPKGERWRVPEGVMRELQTMEARNIMTPEMRKALRAYDIMNNTFKEGVTVPWVAFHVRNWYANLAAIAIDITTAAVNPLRHKEAIDIMRGADGTIVTELGEHITYQQARQQMVDNDIIVDLSQILELAETEGGRRTLMEGRNRVTKPIRTYLNFMGRASRGIENEARALHYYSLLKRGLSPEDAAIRVKQFLFDYSALSRSEKDFMRRLFPFYTWQSKNIRRQVKNLFETPGRVTAQVKPLRDYGPDNDALPEYLRGDLMVRLEGDATTPVKRITNVDFPVVSGLNQIWAGAMDKTFLNLVGQLNPWFKAPLEMAFDRESFTGRPIKGREWMGRNGEFMNKAFPKPLKDLLEFREIQRADGTTGYTVNGTRFYLLFKTWAISRMLNTTSLAWLGVTAKERDERAFAMSKLLTGMEFREYDLTEAHKEALRNRVDRLESYLVERGIAAQMRKVFIPESKVGS